MEHTIDGRVRKSNDSKTRTRQTITTRQSTREIGDHQREHLRRVAASRPRAPNGRFIRETATKECTVCAQTKRIARFPVARISEACGHEPGVCLVCLQTSVKVDFDTKQWDEIGCPECAARLEFGAIAKYADAQTSARYDNLLMQMAVKEMPGFAWCPLEGCTAGQINDPGEYCPDKPASAVCRWCTGVYCLRHNMDWHEHLTCKEFDIVLQGPSEAEDPAECERLQAKMDQAKLKEMQRRAKENQRQIELSEEMIRRDTMQCPQPGCDWQIEKAGGCFHMFCPRCETEFCWDCGGIFSAELYRAGVSYHKTTCLQHRAQRRQMADHDMY